LLTRRGYLQLTNEFVAWAEPIVADLLSRLSQLVSQKSYHAFYRHLDDNYRLHVPAEDDDAAMDDT
jgi:hypothetical protein